MSASAQRVRPGGKLRSIGFGGPGCSCWRRRWRHHRARPGRDAIPRMPMPLRSARRGWRSTSHAHAGARRAVPPISPARSRSSRRWTRPSRGNAGAPGGRVDTANMTR